MLLDFSSPWGIIARRDASVSEGPEEYAEAELAAILGRMTGVAPQRADTSRLSRIIVLDAGSRPPEAGGRRRGPIWSWRASEDRVELWGENGRALLASVYAFLRALGARWVAPGGAGEVVPRGTRLTLACPEGASRADAPAACLALGHGAFLEDWEAQLAWAARSGYSSILVCTTREGMALEAAPYGLYASIKPAFAAFARKVGLDIELAGEIPWSLPEAPFPDIPAETRAREIATRLAADHPEVSVFHAWPEFLPGGGWRGASGRERGASAGTRLAHARLIAEALSRERPGAAISFLARPEDGDAEAAIARAADLPPNLELFWAPRRRSWARALSEDGGRLNSAALEIFARCAAAWKQAGGGRVGVIERWEDGLLFGGAVPPLSKVIEGDIAAYRASGVEALFLLRGGCRLSAAIRPNATLMPRLAGAWGDRATTKRDDEPSLDAAAALSDWATAAYGAASEPMLGYWRELEKAWTIALDIEEGDTEQRDSGEGIDALRHPPSDWGDPRVSDARRLAARRERCEELFDHLRRAESFLEAARDAARSAEPSCVSRAAVLAESDDYAVSGTRLELECARLSVYHELAAGDAAAAADIANLALSVSAALKSALGRCADRRARRESRFLVRALVDLELRSIRRMNARSGVRRTLELWLGAASLALSASRVRRAFERPRKRT